MKNFIQFIIYFIFCLFVVGIVLLPLKVCASPSYSPSVSADITWSSIKNYTDNYCGSYCAKDNIFFNAADGFAKGIGVLTGLPIDGIDSAVIGSSGVLYDFTYQDLEDAYKNNDLSFFQAHLNITGDDYSSLDDVLRPLCDDVIANIDNNMYVYTCPRVSHVVDFINLKLNGQDILNMILGQFGHDENNIYPIYYYRWRDSWGATSLLDINGNNLTVDGLILDYGSWSDFINNSSFYNLHGYLPENCSITNFNFYSNGVKVNAPFRHYLNGGLSMFPSHLEIWPYDIISGEGVRCSSALFSLSGDKQIIFFRTQSAYQNWFNNNSDVYVMPFDFTGFDMSDIDFSDLIRVIENNGGLIGNNISELYKHLSLDLEKYFDKLIIIQSNTNELLVNGFRDVVYHLDDIISVINKINSAPSDDEKNEISSTFDTILQDGSFENRLKHIFPFGYFQDTLDLIGYFEDIAVLNPRWEFNVDLFHSDINDYQVITVDLTDIPSIEVFRSIWFFMIILAINIGCFMIEYKFLLMFFGG